MISNNNNEINDIFTEVIKFNPDPNLRLVNKEICQRFEQSIATSNNNNDKRRFNSIWAAVPKATQTINFKYYLKQFTAINYSNRDRLNALVTVAKQLGIELHVSDEEFQQLKLNNVPEFTWNFNHRLHYLWLEECYQELAALMPFFSNDQKEILFENIFLGKIKIDHFSYACLEELLPKIIETMYLHISSKQRASLLNDILTARVYPVYAVKDNLSLFKMLDPTFADSTVKNYINDMLLHVLKDSDFFYKIPKLVKITNGFFTHSDTKTPQNELINLIADFAKSDSRMVRFNAYIIQAVIMQRAQVEIDFAAFYADWFQAKSKKRYFQLWQFMRKNNLLTADNCVPIMLSLKQYNHDLYDIQTQYKKNIVQNYHLIEFIIQSAMDNSFILAEDEINFIFDLLVSVFDYPTKTANLIKTYDLIDAFYALLPDSRKIAWVDLKLDSLLVRETFFAKITFEKLLAFAPNILQANDDTISKCYAAVIVKKLDSLDITESTPDKVKMVLELFGNQLVDSDQLILTLLNNKLQPEVEKALLPTELIIKLLEKPYRQQDVDNFYQTLREQPEDLLAVIETLGQQCIQEKANIAQSAIIMLATNFLADNFSSRTSLEIATQFAKYLDFLQPLQARLISELFFNEVHTQTDNFNACYLQSMTDIWLFLDKNQMNSSISYLINCLKSPQYVTPALEAITQLALRDDVDFSQHLEGSAHCFEAMTAKYVMHLSEKIKVKIIKVESGQVDNKMQHPFLRRR